jgi:hypothetical protein
VAHFSKAAPSFRERGAELAFIGNGTAVMAADFRERDGVTADLYTDPRRLTYAALGAKRGMSTLLDPRAALAGARSLSSGNPQTATAGDALQQGGELVILPGGKIAFLHLAGYAGDHATVDAVLAAIPA